MSGDPDRRRELGGFIRERRSESRLSLRRLSQMAGVSNPYLSQIERGLRKPSAEILQQIARALEISAETMYVRAGILDEASIDLGPAIRRDPNLSEEQKDRLEEMYNSFVESNRAAGQGPAPTGAPAPSGDPAPCADPAASGWHPGAQPAGPPIGRSGGTSGRSGGPAR